jgi:translation elongation factor IF5A
MTAHHDFSEDLNFTSDSHDENLTFPRAAGELKKGDLVCVNGVPCRVLDCISQVVSKHGSAKFTADVVGIFDMKKREITCPSAHQVLCPFLSKAEYLLIDIDREDGKTLTVLNDDNEEQQHLALPFEHDESLARAIRAHHDHGKTVTLVAHRAMGIEQIVAFKVSADCGK